MRRDVRRVSLVVQVVPVDHVVGIVLVEVVVVPVLLGRGLRALGRRLLLEEAVVLRSVLAVPRVVCGVGILVLLRVAVVLILAVLLHIVLAVHVIVVEEPMRRDVRRVSLVVQVVTMDHVIGIVLIEVVVVPIPLGLGLRALGRRLLLKEAVVLRSVLAVPRVVCRVGVLVLLCVAVALVLAVLLHIVLAVHVIVVEEPMRR